MKGNGRAGGDVGSVGCIRGGAGCAKAACASRVVRYISGLGTPGIVTRVLWASTCSIAPSFPVAILRPSGELPCLGPDSNLVVQRRAARNRRPRPTHSPLFAPPAPRRHSDTVAAAHTRRVGVVGRRSLVVREAGVRNRVTGWRLLQAAFGGGGLNWLCANVCVHPGGGEELPLT